MLLRAPRVRWQLCAAACLTAHGQKRPRKVRGQEVQLSQAVGAAVVCEEHVGHT